MHSGTSFPTKSIVRKASLFYFVFVMYSYTTAGPFGLEDQVATSGPGMTLIYHLALPFFWCIPISVVVAELTSAMPVEGGFYRWTRAAFGDLWGFLAGWWNWCASFLLGGDRKSTRLNSSHTVISYAVFCLKKKKCKPTARAAPATAGRASIAGPSVLSRPVRRSTKRT